MGLGGMLYPRAAAVTSSSRSSGASRGLQRQGQAAARSESTAGTAAVTAPLPAAAAAAGAGPHGHLKPMLPTGPHYTTKAFPASHPLPMNGEQTAGISTSAAAAAAGTAPVQAVAKGELPVCCVCSTRC
jgi:hypothetical protein